MKKALSYILISLIISANLLAPISVGWGKNKIEIQKNEASAAGINFDGWDGSINGYKNAFIASSLSQNSSMYVQSSNSSDLSLTVKIDTGVDANTSSLLNWLHLKRTPTTGSVVTSVTRIFSWNLIGDQNLGTFKNTELFVLKVVENGTNNIGWIDVTSRVMAGYLETTIDKYLTMPNAIQIPMTFNSTNGLASFKPGATYTVGLYYLSDGNEDNGESGGETIKGLENNGANYYKIVETTVNTADELNQIVGTGNVDEATTTPGASQNNSKLPACSVDPISTGTFMGCVVQFFYYVLFVPTSYLFALAGTMFDYTFSYSVQDSSYRSAFVTQGWGLVRDFCNMFFIFIMLYVAIGTILSLHSMKTKETIINVVIIGLFINFSLFATQVMIDASNITARVFYNSDAIKITEKSAAGVQNNTPGLEIGADGTIPLSAAIVNKVNPQNLIMSADKINSIKNNSTNGVGNVETTSLGTAQFILVIIMASAVNIVGFTVFLTIAFLFIARVVGLWMAMIIAPLAFFTYILPEMAGTKMIGWKHWWSDTLSLAFLAPVFIFFMYIILKFLQADLITDIVGKSMSGDGLGYFVAILVPFAFIMLFMIKAKKIAVDMSGEFGEMAVKAGSAIGGMALGGAIGAGAFAMRGTIGKMGNALAESKFAKTNGRFGRMLGDAGKWTSGKSFDVRSTSLGGDAMKGMGVDAGKAKEGGYAKHKADVQKKREERAKSLEVGHDEHEMHDLHEKEEGLQTLKNAKSTELTAIQGKIDAWGIDSREKDIRANQLEQRNENIRKSGGTVTQDQENEAVEARAKAISIAKNLQDVKDKKDEIRNDTSDGVMTSVSQKAVDVSNEDAVAAEDEARVARTSANAARNTLNNIPAEEQAAIARAQADAQAATTQAQADAQAAITRAQADAKNAEQAKLTAFTRKMENPSSKEASDAYEEAKNNDTIAKTNLVSVTNNAPAEAQAAAAKAQVDAQVIITDAQTKAQAATTKAQADAQTAITKAQTEAQAATAKAQVALNTAETMATKKETSATGKRARATEIETAHINKTKIARSMNDLEFQEVPEAKQVISTISAGRKTEYATEIKGYWFNHNANEHAAHNIRMNAEIKSDGKVGH